MGAAPTDLDFEPFHEKLIVLIVGIYWRGRSPGPHGGGQIPVDPGRLRNRRWHERWLEYRGLAERFRYAELLYPLEAEVVKSLAERAPHNGHDSRGWAHRYFEWRFGQAQWPPRDAGTDELGESSTATAGAIGRLIGDVDTRLAEGRDHGDPVESLEPLVPEVRAFWNLVTSEATGWQATLRDKNVPLP